MAHKRRGPLGTGYRAAHPRAPVRPQKIQINSDFLPLLLAASWINAGPADDVGSRTVRLFAVFCCLYAIEKRLVRRVVSWVHATTSTPTQHARIQSPPQHPLRRQLMPCDPGECISGVSSQRMGTAAQVRRSLASDLGGPAVAAAWAQQDGGRGGQERRTGA